MRASPGPLIPVGGDIVIFWIVWGEGCWLLEGLSECVKMLESWRLEGEGLCHVILEAGASDWSGVIAKQ